MTSYLLFLCVMNEQKQKLQNLNCCRAVRVKKNLGHLGKVDDNDSMTVIWKTVARTWLIKDLRVFAEAKEDEQHFVAHCQCFYISIPFFCCCTLLVIFVIFFKLLLFRIQAFKLLLWVQRTFLLTLYKSYLLNNVDVTEVVA